jgi:hypothetical protein
MANRKTEGRKSSGKPLAQPLSVSLAEGTEAAARVMQLLADLRYHSAPQEVRGAAVCEVDEVSL